MASIRKLPTGRYQVQIRRVGMPAVTRSFSRKRDAESFARTVEGDSELARKLGKASAHIPRFRDWCDTYMAQYRGRDRGTVGMLRWWCEQFADRPVTVIDEFLVDEGLIALAKRGGDRFDHQSIQIQALGGVQKTVSRARRAVREHSALTAACLRVTVHQDGAAEFRPKPDDPELRISCELS